MKVNLHAGATQDPEYLSFDHLSSNMEHLKAAFSVFAPLCHIKARWPAASAETMSVQG